METLYILAALVLCTGATLSISRKNPALPYVFFLALLPGTVNVAFGSVYVWGSDLLSVTTLLVLIGRQGLSPPFRLNVADFLLPFIPIWSGIGFSAFGMDSSSVVQGICRTAASLYLPYLVARMGATTWEGMKRVLNAMIVTGLVVTLFTAYEALTGNNVLSAFGLSTDPDAKKWDLWRSKATFNSIHILGMFLGFLSVICLSLFFASTKTQKKYLFFTIVLLVGTVMSTSATGVMLAAVGFGFLCLFPFRQYWKIWFFGLLFLHIAAHFASSSGIHYVYARRLTFLGVSYYRAELIDEVLRRMPGHWLLGLGTEKVTLWYLTYEDMCNWWLSLLARGGLPCFACFSAFYVLMLLRLKECYSLLLSYKGEIVFLWGMLSALVALAISMNFISLYGSDVAFFSFLYGLVVSMPDLARASLANRSEP